MADVKITELPDANVPNAATVVPCVIQGTTKKLSLANLKSFLDIPTIFVTKVQAADPLETVPNTGIVGEGSISIRESGPDTPGSMSSEHYNRVQNATFSTVANRLVIRDSTGSFKANNIELVGIESDVSGTISGNLSQRKSTDTGVNAKLGETTRYTAKVTTLNAESDVDFGSTLDVAGIFKVGTGATATTINPSGVSSFGGAMTVNGGLTVTGVLNAEINTTGTAKAGKFSTLTAATFTCDGASTLSGDTVISGNLTMGSGKSLAIPNGSVSAATITASDRVISDIHTAAQGRTAQFYGVLTGSAEKLTSQRSLNVSGVITGSTPPGVGFDGSSNATIVTNFVDGVIKDRHLAADADINDSKLKTITTAGKVADSATSATPLNNANTIVRRNAAGDFAARQITADSFIGTATYATALTSGSLSAGYVWTGEHKFKNTTTSGGILTTYPFPLTCQANNGAGAGMSFQIVGNRAINLGLDNDRVFRLGGWDDANTSRWSSDTAGNFTARGNVTAYSDDKLKRDWKNLGTDVVSQLAALKSGTFERIDSGSRQVGVSAQSLKQILPEAVMEDGEGTMSVAYGNAALALCVELAKEIVQLKKVIAERV